MPCSEAVLLSGVTPSSLPLLACCPSLLLCFLEASCLRAVGSLHQGLSLASPCLHMCSHALQHLDIMLKCKLHAAVCFRSLPNGMKFCHTLLFAVLPSSTMCTFAIPFGVAIYYHVVLPHPIMCICTMLDCTLTRIYMSYIALLRCAPSR